MFDRPQTLAEAETRIRQTVTVEELLGLFAKCAKVYLFDNNADEFIEDFERAKKIASILSEKNIPPYSRLEAHIASEKITHPDIRHEVFSDVAFENKEALIGEAKAALVDSGKAIIPSIGEEYIKLKENAELAMVRANIVYAAKRDEIESLFHKLLSKDEEHIRLDRARFEAWREKCNHKKSAKAKIAFSEAKRAYRNYSDERMREIARKHPAMDDPEVGNLFVYAEALAAERAKLEESILNTVKNRLLEASPVSEEDADLWLEQHVTITKNLKTNLASQGYPLEIFKKDCKEFFRLTGGKLGMLELSYDGRGGTSGRSRAYGDKKALFKGQFSKRTVFHELGHCLESCSNFSVACSRRFVTDNATGGQERLSVITGHRGYKANEIAYRGNYISPYVGKVYGDHASEVFSMGIERLSDAKSLVDFIQVAPEHASLIFGVCLAEDAFSKKRFKPTRKEQAKLDKVARSKALTSKLNKAIRNSSAPSILKDLIEHPRYSIFVRNKFDGYYLETAGAKKQYFYLYWNHSDTDKQEYIGNGNKKSITILLYLHLAKDKIEELRERSNSDISLLANEFAIGEFPYWFTEEKSLPKV